MNWRLKRWTRKSVVWISPALILVAICITLKSNEYTQAATLAAVLPALITVLLHHEDRVNKDYTDAVAMLGDDAHLKHIAGAMKLVKLVSAGHLLHQDAVDVLCAYLRANTSRTAANERRSTGAQYQSLQSSPACDEVTGMLKALVLDWSTQAKPWGAGNPHERRLITRMMQKIRNLTSRLTPESSETIPQFAKNHNIRKRERLHLDLSSSRGVDLDFHGSHVRNVRFNFTHSHTQGMVLDLSNCRLKNCELDFEGAILEEAQRFNTKVDENIITGDMHEIDGLHFHNSEIRECFFIFNESQISPRCLNFARAKICNASQFHIHQATINANSNMNLYGWRLEAPQLDPDSELTVSPGLISANATLQRNVTLRELINRGDIEHTIPAISHDHRPT